MAEAKVCSNCSFSNEGEEFNCCSCGHKLDELAKEMPEQNLTFQTDATTSEKKPEGIFKISLWEKIIILAILTICILIIIPNPNRSKRGAVAGACIWNMRVLQGAIEKHNNEKAPVIRILDDASINKLLTEKYLNEMPVCHASGKYQSTGDLIKNGEIRCSVHGSVHNFKEDADASEALNK